MTKLEYKFMNNNSNNIYIYISPAQVNNNSNKNNNNKNCPTHGFNQTQLNPCGLGWVGFFLTHYGELGRKTC